MTGIRIDSLTDAKLLRLSDSREASPASAISIYLKRRRVYAVTDTLEAVGRRMEFARRLRYPTNNYLSLSIREPSDVAGEVARETLFALG